MWSPPPPALRKVGVRETWEAFSAPGQVAYPPSTDSDASPGYSSVGYQSSEMAAPSCHAGGRALFRFVGQASKGHSGNKKNSTQKAKTGHCHCCANETHVALPPPFAPGIGYTLKAQCVNLWK